MSEHLTFDQVLKNLNAANVKYVVVGGLAVVMNGYSRMTVDLDLVIDLSEPNARACIDTLGKMGYQPRLPVKAEELLDPQKRSEWFNTKNLKAFTFVNQNNPLCDVDLLIHSPVTFEQLWAGKTVHEIDGQKIYVASIDDLISMKEVANRPVDIKDIEALQEIKRRTGL